MLRTPPPPQKGVARIPLGDQHRLCDRSEARDYVMSQLTEMLAAAPPTANATLTRLLDEARDLCAPKRAAGRPQMSPIFDYSARRRHDG